MATKKQLTGWMKVLKESQAAIAAERDKLDEAISEMEALRDSCQQACEDISNARDALSELV